MKRALLSAVGVALLGACASGPSLPPKAGPEEVAVFPFNQPPPEGYEVIGLIEAALQPGATREDLIMELRREGAKVGADAVIVLAIQERSEARSGADQMSTARGRAIYWPAETQPADTTPAPPAP